MNGLTPFEQFALTVWLYGLPFAVMAGIAFIYVNSAKEQDYVVLQTVVLLFALLWPVAILLALGITKATGVVSSLIESNNYAPISSPSKKNGSSKDFF